MEDFEWHDPLLITDVSFLQQQDLTHTNSQTHTKCVLPTLCISGASNMANSDDSSPTEIDGRSVLGFSLASPDLVICVGSPYVPSPRYELSPEFLKGDGIDVSLENGIKGSEMEESLENPAGNDEDICTDSSFELIAPTFVEQKSIKHCSHVMSINVGSTDSMMFQGAVQFSEDCCFSGGDIMRTNDPITGDGEGLSLYQTARFGNCSYHFEILESGTYMVDLYFAEIVFTDGPPGMRVFDVYLQDQKVVSCLDIYARVGPNTPLVISDLKTCINGDEGLSIRFEGVIGSPMVCGISIRKYASAETGEVELLKGMGLTYMPQCESPKDIGYGCMDGDFYRLQIEHESQKKELAETKKVLEEVKRENELKNRECQEAWKSLNELRNELMRKSMHVGSLAFAIEGQVKEKGRWFSSLRDLTRKLKLLKMDHIKLSEEATSFKQCLADMDGVGSIIKSKINQHTQLYDDVKIKFLEGVKERKELYNKVLELKGNIRVFCRCRPLNPEEIAAGASMAIDFSSEKDGELTVKSNGISKKIFKFDAVFSPQADQADVFEDTAPLATSVLDGYNVCIFAYGQTGTGKTFTMEGTNDNRGVNYRTLEELFHITEERKNTFRYEISVSVLEVYNEQIRDLLVSGSQPGVTSKRLEIKQVVEGGHHVPGIVEARVTNVNEVWEVLRTGSERIAKTEVQGERLKETQNINRSLSALGDVISALATKSPHIPFRNSKLTHLLQDSLGGDSKTLMFVQISPNENDLTETLCSLNFASRVRGIELGPAKKQMDSTELFKYKQMVEKLKQDLKSKDFQVKKMEDINHGLEVKIKEKDVKSRNLQDKIKELESQLLVERKLARQHVDSRIAEQQQQQEEENREPVRAPFAIKVIGVHKAQCESKDQVNITRPFAENNKFSTRANPTDGLVKHNDLSEKENNPEMAERLPLPKRTGRASLCTTAQMISAVPAQRRNSLIPLPSLPVIAKPLPFLPLTPIQGDTREEVKEVEVTCLPEQSPCESPKDHRIGSKKLSSILRRSLHKKIQIKSPMQPHARRIGVNVGMEKVRVSIGSRGRMGHRAFPGNARRVVTKDTQQKQSTREKERGWNIGTTTRNVL
ncbi:Di-glucose binding protein with Kinesin motor domain [Forsythia ovata]|uniref:Di-glucose binding protein with Kinesin motor domain n=1 Tax=Forsythia ovata TaxID=205694 RepID=A0ABD1S9R1_9LAMI